MADREAFFLKIQHVSNAIEKKDFLMSFVGYFHYNFNSYLVDGQ